MPQYSHWSVQKTRQSNKTHIVVFRHDILPPGCIFPFGCCGFCSRQTWMRLLSRSSSVCVKCPHHHLQTNWTLEWHDSAPWRRQLRLRQLSHYVLQLDGLILRGVSNRSNFNFSCRHTVQTNYLIIYIYIYFLKCWLSRCFSNNIHRMALSSSYQLSSSLDSL